MTQPTPPDQQSAVISSQPASMAPRGPPPLGELIVKTLASSKERSGVSAAALKKALAAGGYDVDKNNTSVKTTIKSLVAKWTLVQTKGTGASGSFKMNEKAVETKAKKPTKKAAPKAKNKPAAKKLTAAKKPKAAAAKKPAAAAKKSPKKAKKSAAVKKVAKSPKKATKSPKKVAKKSTAAKKAPAKKAAKPKVKKTAAPKK
ncbi:histone H1-like [Perca fluviatilis]|uniref:histone H1-like n=1 Tax=Perca fluviatilis TaxID=8168 RepID=UPI001965D885|nr:histone H1-like [Perca fluviatilis]